MDANLHTVRTNHTPETEHSLNKIVNFGEYTSEEII
jgi:hypothetical protein